MGETSLIPRRNGILRPRSFARCSRESAASTRWQPSQPASESALSSDIGVPDPGDRGLFRHRSTGGARRCDTDCCSTPAPRPWVLVRPDGHRRRGGRSGGPAGHVHPRPDGRPHRLGHVDQGGPDRAGTPVPDTRVVNATADPATTLLELPARLPRRPRPSRRHRQSPVRATTTTTTPLGATATTVTVETTATSPTALPFTGSKQLFAVRDRARPVHARRGRETLAVRRRGRRR